TKFDVPSDSAAAHRALRLPSRLHGDHPQHLFDRCDSLGDFVQRAHPHVSRIAAHLLDFFSLTNRASNGFVKRDNFVNSHPPPISGLVAFIASPRNTHRLDLIGQTASRTANGTNRPEPPRQLGSNFGPPVASA